MDSSDLLRLKIRLLTEGATLPEGFWSGRKGGAGPVGGRYFILPNGSSCGIPIRDATMAQQYGSSFLEPQDDERVWIFDSSVQLEEVPKPAFYDMQTEDGVPYYKIALLHGPSCLATTVYQACTYWSTGDQCKYCTIPMSHLSGNTITEKNPEQMSEVVQAAESEGMLEHILLTTGTPESPDMGINRLVEISKAIREVSDLPIAVQFEPPKDVEVINKLADVDVDAVGIHLESADEKVRKDICPGKYRHGNLDLYNAAWERSLEFFSEGDVSTFILYGLGEDRERTLDFCSDIASRGILPIITPIRPSPSSQLGDFIPSYVNSLDDSIEFYQNLGIILAENNINPKETSAGCSRCGGCTPIHEAYDWAKHH
jgi:radical SAM protein (TIGR04043 family)